MAFLGGPVLSRKINVTGNAHAAKTEAVAGARCVREPLARGPRRGAGVGGSGASPARLGPRPERLMRGPWGRALPADLSPSRPRRRAAARWVPPAPPRAPRGGGEARRPGGPAPEPVLPRRHAVPQDLPAGRAEDPVAAVPRVRARVHPPLRPHRAHGLRGARQHLLQALLLLRQGVRPHRHQGAGAAGERAAGPFGAPPPGGRGWAGCSPLAPGTCPLGWFAALCCQAPWACGPTWHKCSWWGAPLRPQGVGGARATEARTRLEGTAHAQGPQIPTSPPSSGPGLKTRGDFFCF